MKYLTSFLAKLTALWKTAMTYYPEILPRGRGQFDAWADSIISRLDPELADVPVVQKKYVLATMLINLDKKQDRFSQRHFIKQMNKAATNQVAAQVFQEIQEAEIAEKQKQMADKQAVGTPSAMLPRT